MTQQITSLDLLLFSVFIIEPWALGMLGTQPFIYSPNSLGFLFFKITSYKISYNSITREGK